MEKKKGKVIKRKINNEEEKWRFDLNPTFSVTLFHLTCLGISFRVCTCVWSETTQNAHILSYSFDKLEPLERGEKVGAFAAEK